MKLKFLLFASSLAFTSALFCEEGAPPPDKTMEDLLREFVLEKSDPDFKIQKSKWIIHRNQSPDKKEKFVIEFPGYADLSVEEGIVFLSTAYEDSKYELRFFGKPEKSWKIYEYLEDFVEAIIDEVKDKQSMKITRVKGVIDDGNFKVAIHAIPLIEKTDEAGEKMMVQEDFEIRMLCVGTPRNAYVLSVEGKDLSRAKYFFNSFAVTPDTGGENN